MQINKKAIYALLAIFFLAAISVGVFFYFHKQTSETTNIVGDKSVKIFYGKIVEKQASNIKLVSNAGAIAPIVGEDKVDKNYTIIKVDQKTVFKKYTNQIKSQEEFLQEQSAFEERVKKINEEGADAATLEAPSWNVQITISLNELSLGDIVRVFALKEGDDYLAQEVIVQVNDTKKEISSGSKPEESYLFGKVKEVNSDLIKLSIDGPAEGAEPIVENIYFNDDAKVVYKKRKTEQEYQRELAAINGQLKNGENSKWPEWYVYRDADREDLIANLTISVYFFQNDERKVASRIEIIE